MKLTDVLTATGGRISEGSESLWECWGSNGLYLDFVDTDGSHYASCLYDTKTFDVYQAMVTVPGYNQAFLWVNPIKLDLYLAECDQRGVNPNIAWDNVEYTNVSQTTILEYLKDVGETYYDNLPIPTTGN